MQFSFLYCLSGYSLSIQTKQNQRYLKNWPSLCSNISIHWIIYFNTREGGKNENCQIVQMKINNITSNISIFQIVLWVLFSLHVCIRMSIKVSTVLLHDLLAKLLLRRHATIAKYPLWIHRCLVCYLRILYLIWSQSSDHLFLD